MSINIETERLILRQFSTDDAVELHKICNEAYILKWMPDWKSSVEERRSWIEWVEKQYPLANKETARIMLAVTLKANGKLIGMVGLGNKEEVDNKVEIAYFISEKYSDNRYISEAAQAMKEWAFHSLKLDCLIAIVELDNLPSQKVAEKCGFIRINTRMILNSGETRAKPFYYYRIVSSN